MTRVLCLTVGRNEADRYLAQMLENTAGFADAHFFYDDQSTDDTAVIAKSFCTEVITRPSSVPPFIENEGAFRQAAWDAFNETLNPHTGDWVLSIDCDEFLIASHDPRVAVRTAIDLAIDAGNVAVAIPIPEVFRADDDGVHVRTDGYWGTIVGTRLFEWRFQGAKFRDKKMGSGSEPLYVANGTYLKQDVVKIMHFGYADPADQKLKHERYTNLTDHGHADKHVQSIITPPTLARWDGPLPSVGIPARAAS